MQKLDKNEIYALDTLNADDSTIWLTKHTKTQIKDIVKSVEEIELKHGNDGKDGENGKDGKIKAVDINFSGLPTSSTGLVAGDVWNDAGTLKII